MISSQPITLAPRTFALLEGLLQQLEPGQDILRVMLSRKLERARVVFAPGSSCWSRPERPAAPEHGAGAHLRPRYWAIRTPPEPITAADPGPWRAQGGVLQQNS